VEPDEQKNKEKIIEEAAEALSRLLFEFITTKKKGDKN